MEATKELTEAQEVAKNNYAQLVALRAENARLREVERVQATTTIRIDSERARLSAENARLRKALQNLTDRIGAFNGQTACSPEFAAARAALSEAS